MEKDIYVKVYSIDHRSLYSLLNPLRILERLFLSIHPQGSSCHIMHDDERVYSYFHKDFKRIIDILRKNNIGYIVIK